MSRRVLRMVALALALAPAAAQPGDGAGIQFTHIGRDAGLPSSRVFSIAQDSLGFVWVTTNDGVSRYDGVRFQTWRQGTGGLSSNVAYAVHVDRAGTVWAATGSGLSRFDRRRGTFKSVAAEALEAFGVSGIRYIESDAHGLWLSAPEGIFLLDAAGRVTLRERGVLSSALLTQVNGEVWARACPLGAQPDCKVYSLPDPLAPAAGWRDGGEAFVVTRSGDVLRDGALVPDRPRWPSTGGAFALVLAGPDRGWYGSESGLLHFLPGAQRLEQMGEANGLRGTDVKALFEDRQGGVWVGTELGLHRWTPPRSGFRAETVADGLGDGRVNGITTVGGDTWVATNGGLFRRRPDGSYQGYLTGLGLQGSAVWQVTPARGGGLWLGGKRFGLHRFWPETGRREPVDEVSRLLGVDASGVVLGVPVRHVAERDGIVWVGTSYGLAVRDGGGRWRAFREGEGGRDGLAADPVNFTYIDVQGRVWVASDGGLDEFLPGRSAFRRTGASRGLDNPVVWHVAEVSTDPGALWLATVGAGACRYDIAADRAQCITTADGLPSNVVHRIEPGDGALWVGTDRGIVRLDPRTMETVTFTQADGLHGDVIDLMSSHRAPDGTIWMGGPGGFTSFQPREVRPSAFRPPVRFASVEIGGETSRAIAAGDTLVLRRGARRFAAEFAALDFTRPASNRYRYRLTPLEEDWTDAVGAVEARYAALPPGAYTLEVLGSNHAGVFTKRAATLHIQVPPAWWERGAVQSLLVLLGLGAVGGIGWSRTRQSERRRAEAVEVSRRLSASREAERMRLARELHDGTMQHLYRVGHDLDRLATLVPAGEEGGVASARSTLDQASDELRGVLSDIRLPHVGTFGAAAAVRFVAERFERVAPDVAVTLDLSADGRRWPIPVQHAATRIVQEALANVARHADAQSVTVSLAERDGRAEIAVEDDGRGFDVAVSEVVRVRGDHFGLVGLRERAEALGGCAEVTSARGQGTRVLASLPLDEAGHASD